MDMNAGFNPSASMGPQGGSKWLIPLVTAAASAFAGSRSQSRQNAAQAPMLAPGVQGFLNTFQPYYNQVGSGNLNPAIPEDMQLTAGWNPLQAQAAGQMSNWAGGSQGFNEGALGAVDYLLNSGDRAQNPLLNFGLDGLGSAAGANGGFLNDSESNVMLDFWNSLSGQTGNALSSILDGSMFAPQAGGGANGGGSFSGYDATAWGGGGPGYTATPYTENPAIQALLNATNDETVRAFQRNELSGLGVGALQAGQFGSSRHGIAQGVAMGDLARSMATNSANTRFQDYNEYNNRETQLRIAGMNAQASGASAAGAGQQAMARLNEDARQANLRAIIDAAGLSTGVLQGGFNQGSQNQQWGISNILDATNNGQTYTQNGMNIGLGAIPGINSANVGNLEALMGMGTGLQQTQQAGLTSNLNRYMNNAGLSLADLQSLSGMLGQIPLGNWNAGGQNQGSTTGAGMSSAMSALGLYGQLFGSGGTGTGGGGGGG